MTKLTKIMQLNQDGLVNYSQKLNTLLSSYQVINANIKGYHWNIQGINFFQFHEVFDKMYSDLASDIDDLAERIITLGFRENQTFSEYIADSKVEVKKDIYQETQILESVLADLERLMTVQLDLINYTADLNDSITNDLLIGFEAKLEKYFWQLSVSLK